MGDTHEFHLYQKVEIRFVVEADHPDFSGMLHIYTGAQIEPGMLHIYTGAQLEPDADYVIYST